MQIVAFIFFSAALLLALTVVLGMLAGRRHQIVDALRGAHLVRDALPTAEVFYLQPRKLPDIEWRKAA